MKGIRQTAQDFLVNRRYLIQGDKHIVSAEVIRSYLRKQRAFKTSGGCGHE